MVFGYRTVWSRGLLLSFVTVQYVAFVSSQAFVLVTGCAVRNLRLVPTENNRETGAMSNANSLV